ncbi:CUE domain containing [Chlorella sorokiniana]|jgi:hypothetical protein|uniref:CUE domain containing n=1 Tax=Chlorella sorokiniana TaxID=3076 RepID=A0A2P6TYH3_CHLSO|nr:CUE domain containing [Chlorella sorokiniana]|eukprot:PRW59117.1 CUE domain containing [Chlorella sorokiniana]
MSVATQHSPFAVGSKRLFESEENEDRLQRRDSGAATHKRYRRHGSPADRCGSGGCQGAYAVSPATLAALRGLFPEMSDKVIADVLAEYGDNIDAAIKHLTDLRLATPSTSAAATPEQQAAAAAAAADQQRRQQEQAAAQQAQQEQQPQQQQQGAADAGPAGQPHSADEWIDIVVREMAAATDLADARARASKVLQAFEQVAVQHAKQGAPGDPEQLRGQLAEALRENQLLKRAVAIQNTRLQELSGKEAEVAQLRQMLEGFQQKVHALEVQNYSLAMHLRQATDGKDAMAAGGFNKNPDVF